MQRLHAPVPAVRLASFAAVTALALACQRQPESPEAHEVKTAVARYNQVLVQAYRASKAELMQEVAGENEVARVAAVIAGLAAQSKFMEARPPRLEYRRVRVEAAGGPPVAGDELAGKTAEVGTEEDWTYEHRSLAERDRATEPKKAKYRMTYRLERSPHGWYVMEAFDEDHPPARIRR